MAHIDHSARRALQDVGGQVGPRDLKLTVRISSQDQGPDLVEKELERVDIGRVGKAADEPYSGSTRERSRDHIYRPCKRHPHHQRLGQAFIERLPLKRRHHDRGVRSGDDVHFARPHGARYRHRRRVSGQLRLAFNPDEV